MWECSLKAKPGAAVEIPGARCESGGKIYQFYGNVILIFIIPYLFDIAKVKNVKT